MQYHMVMYLADIADGVLESDEPKPSVCFRGRSGR
jgi:hypothetical protein